jgi:hypothetical protein
MLFAVGHCLDANRCRVSAGSIGFANEDWTMSVEIIGVRIDEESSPYWHVNYAVNGLRQVHKVRRAEARNSEEAERVAARELKDTAG